MSLDDVLGQIASDLRGLPANAAVGVARFESRASSATYGARAYAADGAQLEWDESSDATDAVGERLVDLPPGEWLGDVVRTGDRWSAVVTTSPDVSIMGQGLTRRVRDIALAFAAPTELPDLTPAQVEDLGRVWRAHAAAYEAGEPATPDQLAALEGQLGFPVPPALRHLLAVVNGATPEFPEDAGEDDDDPDAWASSLPTRGWSLLTTEEIARDHAMWCDLARTTTYADVALDPGVPGATQPRLAHPGWLPFATDHGGNQLALDLVPGPRGILGQVIEFGRDLSDGPLLVAPSIADWLAGRLVDGVFPPEHLEDHRDAGGPVLVSRPDPQTETLRVFNGAVPADALRLPRLKTLLVRGGSVDLAGLRDAPQLQELRLLDLTDVDLAPLAGHPTLRIVALEGVGAGVRGLDALARLPRLEVLSLPTDLAERAVPLLASHPVLASITLLGDARPLGRELAIVGALDAPDGQPLAATCSTHSGDVPPRRPPSGRDWFTESR